LNLLEQSNRWNDTPEDEEVTAQEHRDSWQKNMPIILAVGTFEGELNDLMFGIVNPTQEIMRVKASYVKDYSDGAVLANIVVPTVEDPFRSVSVKWTQINLPLNQTGLVQNRDFVCLEATGILHFANGDRVGYQLLHSIDFPNTQPLPGTIRARHKIIGFYCQISRNVIDTYAFDTVHPGGKVFRSVALNACQSVRTPKFSDADERFSQSVFTTKKKAVQMGENTYKTGECRILRNSSVSIPKPKLAFVHIQQQRSP
ncbi:hypothetical protein JG688_00013923, partial [Phytophthora aleatoria]